MPRFAFFLVLIPSLSGPLSARDDARSQDDRTVPLGTVRTWYAVLDGDRKVGYANESLESLSGPRRFRYSLHGEMVVGEDEDERHHSLRAVALLDEAYAMRKLRARFRVNDAETTLSLVTSKPAPRMHWTTPGAGVRTWNLPDDPDLYALPTQMFYALRQSGALADTGIRRARLLDTRAEGDPVVEVVFRVKALQPRAIGGRRVPVTPVTFLKPPPSSGREDELVDAFIDKYGRMVEATTRSGLRIVWVRGEREAMEGISFLPRRDRIDPLDKIRAFRPWPPDPLTPTGPAVETVEVDALDSTFARAKKDLAELREHKAAGRLSEVRRGYGELLKTWKMMRATAADQAPLKVAEIDSFRDACEEVWDGATRVFQKALTAYGEAEGHLRRDECAELKDRIGALRALAVRLEVELRPEGESIRRWIAILEPELANCRLRRELAAFPLILTGTTLAEEKDRAVLHPIPEMLLGPMGPPIEVPYSTKVGRAIVNGEVYRAGDVERRTGVTIEVIRKHGITVSYKGQLRDVPLYHR